jgi:hypothetical protein
MPVELRARPSKHARVDRTEQGWRFELGTQPGMYHLAQLDDYSKLPRRKFAHRPPFHLALRARASHSQLPGTWGFGLWNDPFGLSLGFGGSPGRLPGLPNAAWFFFASEENHLALNDALPGNGQLAAVYCAPRWPALALAPGLLALPLLAAPLTARWLRKAASAVVRQDAVTLDLDPAVWHSYELNWQADAVEFKVDGAVVLRSSLAPRPPLALVLWLDNQYAAWRPNGRIGFGTQAPLPGSWVELQDLRVH